MAVSAPENIWPSSEYLAVSRESVNLQSFWQFTTLQRVFRDSLAVPTESLAVSGESVAVSAPENIWPSSEYLAVSRESVNLQSFWQFPESI